MTSCGVRTGSGAPLSVGRIVVLLIWPGGVGDLVGVAGPVETEEECGYALGVQ